MSIEATTSLANWDFAAKHVQQNLEGGDFIGSHSTIICATAPRAKDLAAGLNDLAFDNGDTDSNNSAYAIPIGVVDSSTIQQDRQLAQIFEIGSNRSYIMSARTMTQININRVMYKGPNLLRTLYAYYPTNDGNWGEQTGNTFRDNEKVPGTEHSIGLAPEAAQMYSKRPHTEPGYNNFWMNLASDVFSHPMGLVLFWKDNDNSDVAAVFLEECYIQNHVISMSANSVIMAESCSIRCDRVLPIKVNITTLAEQKQNSQNTSNLPTMV